MRAPNAGAFSHIRPVALRYLHGSRTFQVPGAQTARLRTPVKVHVNGKIKEEGDVSQGDVGFIANVEENWAL